MKSELTVSLVFKSFLVLILCEVVVTIRETSKSRRIACTDPDHVPNGIYTAGRRNNHLRRINCNPGYILEGPRIIECVNGRWVGQKPVCAANGCNVNEPSPEHGNIEYRGTHRMTLFCWDNYNLAGNRYVYCNGTHWDRPIGNCREPNYSVKHECDFETDDNCGWVFEEDDGPQWKRVTAMDIYHSYHTGPRLDHTFTSTTGGHYMLLETVHPSPAPSFLMSPVYERDLSLKTACCFQFYYFMYGSGVGDLSVYVRPVSIDIKDMMADNNEYRKFLKSGNQNNLWNEAHFSISELEEDFQIVIVAMSGRSHLSDIAIDDVKLLFGEDCKALDDDENTSSVEQVTDEVLFDTQSCTGRCFESLGAGFVRLNGLLFGRCNCDIDCEYKNSCCPDFRSVCLESYLMDVSKYTEASEEEFHYGAMWNTITAKTTTTTTKSLPTTKKITPTTTTTTTTTTKRTTTASTSTEKPTTSTTTSPTTTTTTARTTPTTFSTTKQKSILQTFTNKTLSTPLTTTSTSTSTTKSTSKITSTTSKPDRTTQRPDNNYTNNITQNVQSWDVVIESSESTQDNFSYTSKILLVVFSLVIVTMLVSTAVFRYKGQFLNWIRGSNHRGDMETTSIRTKFRFNPKIVSLNGQRGDDLSDLLEEDFGIDNESSLACSTKPTKSTNL